jgi:hypothetical protein
MANESRRMRRRPVTALVEVGDTMTGQAVGHLGNLSVGGLLLVAHAPLVDDALYQLRFVVPDGDPRELEAGAHVLWREAANAPGQWWVGLRFLGLSPEARERLEAWVHQEG